MNHARFDILHDTPKEVVICDVGPWDQHLTVTNDAEYVLERLAVHGLGNRKLKYLDSDGNYDEILHENGLFRGFRPIPIKGKERP